jgi:hypothetical protein
MKNPTKADFAQFGMEVQDILARADVWDTSVFNQIAVAARKFGIDLNQYSGDGE